MKCLRIACAVVGFTVMSAVCAQAVLEDTFPGASLSSYWDWNHMGTCGGSVNNGLILNPSDGDSGWRQAAIVTEQASYSWVSIGGLVSYQMDIQSWDLTSNNNVAARMYLSTTDGLGSADPWDDYNNSNGVMAELSLNGGTFWFNLFQKTGEDHTSYNNDGYKLGFLNVGSSVDGYTFGMDFNGSSASLWYDAGAGRVASGGMTVATSTFNQNTRFYVGVINGTGSDLGPSETVTFSRVAIIPEPTAVALLLGGLFLLRRRIRA